MAGITQNKQTPYFHCDPQKNNKKEKQKGVSKSLKDSKTACKQEQYNLISCTDDS